MQGAREQKAIDDKRYEEYLVYMNKQLTDSLASQRKTIIDKACEWLRECVGTGEQFKKTLVEKFRKAMEK